MSLTLADAADGDIVVIAGHEWRITGKLNGGYLCREGRNGDTKCYPPDHPIESITFVQPTRKSRASRDDLLDPLQSGNPDNGLLWRGTQK